MPSPSNDTLSHPLSPPHAPTPSHSLYPPPSAFPPSSTLDTQPPRMQGRPAAESQSSPPISKILSSPPLEAAARPHVRIGFWYLPKEVVGGWRDENVALEGKPSKAKLHSVAFVGHGTGGPSHFFRTLVCSFVLDTRALARLARLSTGLC